MPGVATIAKKVGHIASWDNKGMLCTTNDLEHVACFKWKND